MRDEDKKERERRETGLVPVDPLSRYMQTVSKYPLLTDEEEKELVERVQNHRDVEAAKKLVHSHLRLVVKIAMEYRTAFQNVLDLIQEGNVGLLRAVKSFDPTKGARLGYYASWWIRSYILKYILDNFRLIKIGTTQAQRKLFYNLMKEKEKLEKMGFSPGTKLLADRLDVKEEEVEEMDRRLSQSELSIDAPVGDEGGALHVDFLQDPAPPADESLADREFKDVLLDKLGDFSKALNARELKIFQDRLIADMPKTLQEIADEYGITRERVRQIEDRIKEKLKKYFEESGFKVDER
ncbi:MAG: RNA polymerase factor sigma-32 [bacterium]